MTNSVIKFQFFKGTGSAINGINGRTLLQKEEEGNSNQENTYVLSKFDKAGAPDTSDKKPVSSSFDCYSELSSECEAKTHFMQ